MVHKIEEWNLAPGIPSQIFTAEKSYVTLCQVHSKSASLSWMRVDLVQCNPQKTHAAMRLRAGNWVSLDKLLQTSVGQTWSNQGDHRPRIHRVHCAGCAFVSECHSAQEVCPKQRMESMLSLWSRCTWFWTCSLAAKQELLHMPNRAARMWKGSCPVGFLTGSRHVSVPRSFRTLLTESAPCARKLQKSRRR